MPKLVVKQIMEISKTLLFLMYTNMTFQWNKMFPRFSKLRAEPETMSKCATKCYPKATCGAHKLKKQYADGHSFWMLLWYTNKTWIKRNKDSTIPQVQADTRTYLQKRLNKCCQQECTAAKTAIINPPTHRVRTCRPGLSRGTANARVLDVDMTMDLFILTFKRWSCVC